MAESPTERTYAAELAKAISEVGGRLGFDAEVELKTPSGYPDVVIYYNSRPAAVIEVKRPEVPLSDPGLDEQARRYAEWYRTSKGVTLYGVHNMRYLKLFKYVSITEKKRLTLLDFIREGEKRTAGGWWVPVSDFPFKIMPWATSINDYKDIRTHSEARRNLERFLLGLKEALEGRTLDLSDEVIDTVRSLIEQGASLGLAQLEGMYKRDKGVRELVDRWLAERGLERPRSDEELREILMLVLKEQIYVFTMKLLFYLVLQSIDADMAARLKERAELLEAASDPEMFKKVSEELFEYAIERSGDFEEVFGGNTVDRLPFMPYSLPKVAEIVRYLSQVRWGDVNVDVVGRIFEGLIYEERRHLLGQHYTDAKVVDLILGGVFRRGGGPGKLLDPACGSGTFLVRALNYWKVMRAADLEKLERPVYEYVEGVDIDRLASMLAKINLYIQALEKIKEGYRYVPAIRNADFFRVDLSPDYSYVVANPPYTRQEEMSMAYYDRDYKERLRKAVADISGWSERASIYAYFLIGGGRLLREGGRLGFVVENSWLNAEYGRALKRWLFNNFRVEYVVESLAERWFRDAAIITNIIIAEKVRAQDYVARFVFLKKPLEELIGAPPPASDQLANENYYNRIAALYDAADRCSPSGDSAYNVCEDSNVRVVSLAKGLVDKIEEKLGRLAIVRGPRRYLDLVLRFIDGKDNRLVLMKDVLEIRRGLTTNANEVFYLPSKYWKYVNDGADYLALRGPGNEVVKISKRYLRRLIRPGHLRESAYGVTTLPILRSEDYVLWVDDVSRVDDPGAREYVEWARKFVEEEYRTSKGKKFAAIYKSLGSSPSTWLRLPDTSGGLLILRNAVHRNYSMWLNLAGDAQVDERLYLGRLRSKYEGRASPEVVFAVANSVLTYIGVELMGRANLGEGALDVKTVDYEAVPIVDPAWLEESLRKDGRLGDLKAVVNKVLSLRPADIEVEARRPERMEMERLVLGPLGLSDDDIRELYEGLIELTDIRTRRAESVRRQQRNA